MSMNDKKIEMIDENIETIEDFIYLLENRPDFFSDSDRAELERFYPTWPDNYQDIADGLAEWSESHPLIYKALEIMPESQEQSMYQNQTDPNRLPGDGKTAPQPKPEEYKKMLINATRRSFPPSSSHPPIVL